MFRYVALCLLPLFMYPKTHKLDRRFGYGRFGHEHFGYGHISLDLLATVIFQVDVLAVLYKQKTPPNNSV